MKWPVPAARGWRGYRIWSVLAVVVLTGVALIAWFTPALAVRTVEVSGLAGVPEEQVRERVQIPEGRSMLRIDTAAIAGRVASIPKVRTVKVTREFPSTVRIEVEERQAVLYFEAPDGTHLVDADAVEFAVEPPPFGVPALITPDPGADDPVTQAAAGVLAMLPPALIPQVDAVEASTISDVTLTLRDGRTVLWGGVDDGERKAAVVMPLLTREGEVFDVSSPNLVTVR